eukprot:356379_1
MNSDFESQMKSNNISAAQAQVQAAMNSLNQTISSAGMNNTTTTSCMNNVCNNNVASLIAQARYLNDMNIIAQNLNGSMASSNISQNPLSRQLSPQHPQMNINMST